jgi:hypothetical protein
MFSGKNNYKSFGKMINVFDVINVNFCILDEIFVKIVFIYFYRKKFNILFLFILNEIF